MLTERTMHECIKKLLGNVENPEEEEIESLCVLMTTVGALLDSPKARKHMDVYFQRMKELAQGSNVSPQMKPLLQDVIELRDRKWIVHNAVVVPSTLAHTHKAACCLTGPHAVPASTLHPLSTPQVHSSSISNISSRLPTPSIETSEQRQKRLEQEKQESEAKEKVKKEKRRMKKERKKERKEKEEEERKRKEEEKEWPVEGEEWAQKEETGNWIGKGMIEEEGLRKEETEHQRREGEEREREKDEQHAAEREAGEFRKDEEKKERAHKWQAEEAKTAAEFPVSAESEGAKTSERKRPEPLDLTHLEQPSSLTLARPLRDLSSVIYPEGITGPKPELNVGAKEGKFRYDREFLLQFRPVCEEKPESLPPLDAVGLEQLSLTRAGPGNNRHLYTPSGQAFIGSGLRGPLQNMGQFAIPSTATVGTSMHSMPSQWTMAQGGSGGVMPSHRTRSKRGEKFDTTIFAPDTTLSQRLAKLHACLYGAETRLRNEAELVRRYLQSLEYIIDDVAMTEAADVKESIFSEDKLETVDEGEFSYTTAEPIPK
ncbi:hypothetical protein AX15_006786 [Amanita polypyramis BW_CC]|nr:hypothetical protein AX15_006786 [Amanita polypyramis BW_CC]